jgi:hypothetical protein
MPSVLLAGSVVSRPQPRLDPKPHTWFNLRSEGDERIWRVTIYHEDEVPGIDRLAAGDVLSVVGLLNIHPVMDKGKKRLAYEVIGRQLLLLRLRSSERARAMAFAESGAVAHSNFNVF